MTPHEEQIFWLKKIVQDSDQTIELLGEIVQILKQSAHKDLPEGPAFLPGSTKMPESSALPPAERRYWGHMLVCDSYAPDTENLHCVYCRQKAKEHPVTEVKYTYWQEHNVWYDQGGMMPPESAVLTWKGERK